MFKKLTDFAYKRNVKEAFGFYFGYLLIAMIIGAICGGLTPTDATTFEGGFEAGMNSKIIPVIMVIYILSISFLIFLKKKLNFGYLLLLLTNGLVVVIGGALLGLIIPAFVTTRGATREESVHSAV